MNKEEKLESAKAVTALVLLAAAFLVMFALSGCALFRHTPERIVIRDSIYITQRDSLYIRDSVYLKDSVLVEKKNDTVYITKTVQEFKWKDRYKAVHDTLYIDKFRDTIIIKEVEKKLTRLQKAEISFAKMMAGVVVAVLLFFGIKLFRKFF